MGVSDVSLIIFGKIHAKHFQILHKSMALPILRKS